MLEEVRDFLAGFFGVIDGDMLALLGPEGGKAANGFAGVNGGMPRNFKGLLGAICGFYGDDFRALAETSSIVPSVVWTVLSPNHSTEWAVFSAPSPVAWTMTCPPSFPTRSAPLAASLRPWTVVFSVNFTVSTVPSAVFTATLFAPASTFSTVPVMTWVGFCARATAMAKHAARSTRTTRRRA